jgi:hypothetical protein
MLRQVWVRSKIIKDIISRGKCCLVRVREQECSWVKVRTRVNESKRNMSVVLLDSL